MEVSQSRVSQLYGQFQEAGEAGLVVKRATGAPPQLTTEPRAQLPELFSKGAEYDGFEGGGLDQPACWRSHQTTFWGTLRSLHYWSPAETTRCYSPKTDTLLFSPKSKACGTVARGDFTGAQKNGGTRPASNFLGR